MTTVHELEQLHRELDVADAAAAPLELAFGQALALGEILRPFLHRADLAYRIGIEDARATRGARELHEAIAEGRVAGDRARLEQRLELPRLCPALVVRRVAVDRARERPAPSFRAQVGVGAEHDAVLGRGWS